MFLPFFASEEGQGLLEYALLIALVAIIVLILVVIFGEGVGDTYSNIIDNI